MSLYLEIFRRIRVMLHQYSPNEITALEEVVSRRGQDPFKILIATILSQRTRDKNTNMAVDQLFSKYRNIKELAEGDLADIQQLIKPSGFYRLKARSIKEVSQIILDRYQGRVPDNLDNLLTLPSVGRKTANCVLVYGYKKPAIPVDTHVHRISNRLGLVKTRRPEETEKALTKKLDKRYWLEINHLFVRFGQLICKPVIPHCTLCLLKEVCTYYQSIESKIIKAKYA